MYSPREREQRRIVDQRCEKLSHGLGVLEREVDKCRRLFYDLQASWEKEVQCQKDFVIYFHLTCGLPVWLGFFSYKDVAAGFGNFLVPQGSLMSCNIISKCGKDSLMFQNNFLIRIPYSS